MQRLIQLLEILGTQTVDPVAIFFGVALGVISFFLIQFYNQVQKLLIAVQQIQIQNAVFMQQIEHLQKENDFLKNKHHD